LVSGNGFRVPSWGRENGFVCAEKGFVRRVPTKPLHGIEIGLFWVNPDDER
jgi:catalase (peroxidase I)